VNRVVAEVAGRYRDIIGDREAPVAQLIVRNLDDSVKEKLRRRAARRRRSLEAEVRDILSAAVARSESSERDLGSRIARRFAELGIDLDVREWRGHAARAARLAR
jgi:plasmid stability protein